MKITSRSFTHLVGTKPRTVELSRDMWYVIYIPKFDVFFQFRTTFLQLNQLNIPFKVLMHQQKQVDLKKKVQIQQLVEGSTECFSGPLSTYLPRFLHKRIKPHIKIAASWLPFWKPMWGFQCLRIVSQLFVSRNQETWFLRVSFLFQFFNMKFIHLWFLYC